MGTWKKQIERSRKQDARSKKQDTKARSKKQETRSKYISKNEQVLQENVCLPCSVFAVLVVVIIALLAPLPAPHPKRRAMPLPIHPCIHGSMHLCILSLSVECGKHKTCHITGGGWGCVKHCRSGRSSTRCTE